MKQITNESLQGLQVCLITPKGNIMYRLTPGESVVVPASFISEHSKKLHRRRMIKIKNYS